MILDMRYERMDIVEHMNGILCCQSKNRLLSEMLEVERDESKCPADEIFSEYIPDNFIKTCSLILGGLMDGMPWKGKRDASEKLEEDSKLSSIFRHVPLDVVNQILFSKPDMTCEDVKAVLHPGMYSQNHINNIDLQGTADSSCLQLLTVYGGSPVEW